MDIEQMSLMELKALAFDLVRAKDEAQRSLDMVVAQINKIEKQKQEKNDERLSPKPG